MWRAVVILGVAVSAGVLTLVPMAGPATARTPTVLGYYVPYDSTAWESLQAHADSLDFVAAQWVTVDACGRLASRDDQTLKIFAHEHNVKVLPSLLSGSATLNHTLLADPNVAAQLTQSIVEYTLQEGYAGFDLDLEAVESADRDALTDFVTQTASALHAQGKLLALALPAKERDVVVGWTGGYDYAALGAQADLVVIMAYEYRGSFSGPGSVAPYGWVNRVLAFATQQIEPAKLLLGLALYGYDWNTTTGGARPLSYLQAAALADLYATQIGLDPVTRSGTFDYANLAGDALPPPTGPSLALDHDITERAAPPCSTESPAAPPSLRPEPVDGTPQSHEVWIEDSTSALARAQLAARYGVGGIAAWRLGLEDPRVWDGIPKRGGSPG